VRSNVVVKMNRPNGPEFAPDVTTRRRKHRSPLTVAQIALTNRLIGRSCDRMLRRGAWFAWQGERDVTQNGSLQTIGVREGDVLAGKYRVERILGAGGMGVVVAAQHIALDQKVAIKFLLPEVLGNEEAVGRFMREAQAAVRIKSEHVARVIDVGTLDNGAPYMVMEYLEGGDLGAWLEQKGPLPFDQAVEFILQASEAIAEAHGLGIVHRDLKPANLFCVRRADGVLSTKVLDFGISKVTGPQMSGSGMSMTRTSAIIGSPFYMSPEQLRSSRDVDARTDIWSLGVILFQLLTGKTPFTAEALPELFINIVNQPTPLVRNVRPDVPAELEQVICRCMEKERERRYPNIAEMAIAMARFAPKRARSSVERIRGIIQSSGLSASALALPPSSEAAAQTGPPGRTEAAWGQTAASARATKKWALVGGIGATMTIAIAVLVWPKSRAGSETQPRTAIATASTSSMVAESPPSIAALSASPVSVMPTASSASEVVVAPAPTEPAASPPAAQSVVGSSATSKLEKRQKPRVASPTPPPTIALSHPLPVAPAKPKPNCDPPFTLDSEGRKHFKPECYAK
jgi:eukaryotic-like serine/threonine-protein kinase